MNEYMERGTFPSAGMKTADDEPEIPVLPPGEDELPCSDGEPLETNRHRQQMILLIQSLKRAWAHRHDYFVGGNMFVHYSELRTKKNDFRGPDVFVVLETTDRERRSWIAWREGKLPDVVIELLSDRTRHVDRGEKVQIYSRLWRVNQYYLYDPWSHEFEGYQLQASSNDFVPIEPNAQGDLPCVRLGLALGLRECWYEGVHTHWLRWIDAQGDPLLTTEEEADIAHGLLAAERARTEAARARADAERARAEEAERRVRELEARFRDK
jgi:Uma2 family endonuclease